MPGDLEASELEAFRPLDAPQVDVQSGMSVAGTSEESREHIYHRAMISSIRSEMNKLSQLLSIPYVVFLTDKAGTILEPGLFFFGDAGRDGAGGACVRGSA